MAVDAEARDWTKVLNEVRGYFREGFIEADKHVDILAHAVSRRN
jgi:hypothetical protein